MNLPWRLRITCLRLPKGADGGMHCSCPLIVGIRAALPWAPSGAVKGHLRLDAGLDVGQRAVLQDALNHAAAVRVLGHGHHASAQFAVRARRHGGRRRLVGPRLQHLLRHIKGVYVRTSGICSSTPCVTPAPRKFNFVKCRPVHHGIISNNKLAASATGMALEECSPAAKKNFWTHRLLLRKQGWVDATHVVRLQEM